MIDTTRKEVVSRKNGCVPKKEKKARCVVKR
jgi:hypothetical protein